MKAIMLLSLVLVIIFTASSLIKASAVEAGGVLVTPADPVSAEADLARFDKGEIQYFIFTTAEGTPAVVAHGRQTGGITAPDSVVAQASLIVACYPGKQADYYQKEAAGDWFTPSLLRFVGGQFVVTMAP